MFFVARNVLAILFLAIIISAALDAPVSFLERKRIPRILSSIFIFIVCFVVLALILYTIIPFSFFELQTLLNKLSNEKLPVIGSLDLNYSYLIQKISNSLGSITDSLISGEASLLVIITRIFGSAVAFLSLAVLSLYLTIGKKEVELFLRTILPTHYEDYAISLYFRLKKKLGRWLQGQLILMVIIGFSVWLGLYLAGVPYSLILGILAGFLEIVPVAGPIIVSIIGFIIIASQSLELGFYSLILFFILQQIENHFLVPLIVGQRVGLNPVVVVISILVGFELAGIIGVILGVPAAVIFQEVISDWEKKKLRIKNSHLGI
jgi:predicted PurR-regulated permease PerM